MSHTLQLATGNLVSNSGFEGGTTGWSAFGSPSTFAQDNAHPKVGNYALKIISATSTGRGGFTTLSCQSSTVYTVTLNALLTAGTFKLQVNGDVSGALSNNNDLGAANTGFNQTSVTFTTGATDATLTIFILSTTAASTGWFDEVICYQTLINFQDTPNYSLRSFNVAAMGQPYATANLVLDIRGASQNAMFDNLVALKQALELGKRNERKLFSNQYYTPLWLQFQSVTGSTLMQAECFGTDTTNAQGSAIEHVLENPQLILSNRIPQISLALKIRGYFEEQIGQNILASVSQANGAGGSTLGASNVRGDLPAPLKVMVQTPTASQDSLIVAMRTMDGATSFSSRLEIENFTTFGSGVASLTDTNLSPTGAGTTGKQWTVPGTSEQMLARYVFTSTAQIGKLRCLVRCRDNHATTNVRLRVKGGITDGGGTNFQYGDWGDVQKYVNTVAGTTAISLVDCGVITLPPFDGAPKADNDYVIEIWGQADSTSATHTFDLDCVYLLPCNEDANGNGYCLATYPWAAGTGADPTMVITGFDRHAPAYLETTGGVDGVTQNIAGSPLYAPPNQQFLLWCLTFRSSNLRHTLGTNTVTVIAQPRYVLARGS